MRISGSDSPGLRHFLLLLSSLLLFPSRSQSSCDDQCTAVAAYYVSSGQDLTSISRLFGIEPSSIDKRVLPYNNLTSKDSIGANSTVYIPFDCACMGSGDYLGHNFTYIISSGQTYNTVAQDVFVNLTTADWLARVNTYPPNRIPDNVSINVVVNCSCGDRAISTNYGLFATYPLRPGQTLASVANATGFPSADLDMLPKYNPGVSLNGGQGIVFLPVKDANGSYHPLSPSKGGISGGAIAGISVAVVVALILIVGLYIIYRGKKPKRPTLLYASEDQSISHGQVSTDALAPLPGGTSPFVGITVDRSVEFSYEELAKATDNFNLSNKIGEGGFGAVYYAELKGEKTAIKKMDMQASREFLAELKVLTHVHHLNLVRLVGYCIEGSLFLIYEYIENGNLSQHLRSSGREPLSWSQRVQIALDSARGLEYIHEHTVPVYIHRDIKSANILIDKNFHAKVADFGLTKLTEVGSTSLQSRLVGTFGYMPPEYAQYGDVSPKIDVYAFGVVLYELISAKAAVMKTDTVDIESKGLVAMFEDVLSKSDKEALRKVVDPRLGENYPIDAVYKMALLAKACTQETPQLRPSMRSIVVALMTLSSATEDWDVGQFYENHALVNLMSGR